MDHRRKQLTLIIAKRTLTEPKTALASVTPETSFARFTASVAAFNNEMVTSRRFRRWDFIRMVETGGSCGRKGAARRLCRGLVP